jgi:3-oxoadipate enol-lactonase
MKQEIDADGARLAFRLDGPPDAPWVVFSNSLMCDLHMWDAQAAALAGRFRILRYDTRGHGGSEVPGPPITIDSLARDVIALLAALDAGPVHFVGLSLGGMIGQRLGAIAPEILESLTLCDTATRVLPPEMWDERIASARLGGTAALADATIARWFPPGVPLGPETEVRLRRMISRTPTEGFAACALAIRDADLRDDAARIGVPTHVVYGDRDPLAATSQEIADSVAGSRVTVIRDGGHLPNVDHPGEFVDAVAGFIGSVSRPDGRRPGPQ